MDDLGQPGRFNRGPETATSGYYGSAVHGAARLVHAVPDRWPKAVRLTLQVPLAFLGLVYVVAVWILATVMLIVTSIGGGGSTSARN